MRKRSINTLLCYLPLGSETVTFSRVTAPRLSATHFFFMSKLYSQPFGHNPALNVLLWDTRSEDVTPCGILMICTSHGSSKDKGLEAFTAMSKPT